LVVEVVVPTAVRVQVLDSQEGLLVEPVTLDHLDSLHPQHQELLVREMLVVQCRLCHGIPQAVAAGRVRWAEHLRRPLRVRAEMDWQSLLRGRMFIMRVAAVVEISIKI